MNREFAYAIATLEGLERIWEKNIENNKEEKEWVTWRLVHWGGRADAITGRDGS